MTHELGCASIEVASADEDTAALVEALRKDLFIDSRAEPHTASPCLRLNVEAGSRAPTDSPEADPRSFKISLPGARLEVDLDRATARAWLEQPFWGLDRARQREFLTTGWVTLLHSGGVFALHANAMESPLGGVLLVGPSGSGKTTLSAALAAAGWTWMADDIVLLSRSGEGIQAFPLRRGFARAPAGVPSTGRKSKQFHADLPGRDRGPSMCVPRTVVFVSIGSVTHSELSPTDEMTALSRLMEQSPTLLLHPALARTQLEVLGGLLRQSTWLTFRGGQDVLADPTSIARSLTNVMARENARS